MSGQKKDAPIIALSLVEKKLGSQLAKYEQKFQFPSNPAYQVSRAKTAQSLDVPNLSTFCKTNGIWPTKVQESSINIDKRRIEFSYWKRGIERAMNGYNDAEFNELFIDFVNDLNFTLLT